MPYTNRDFPGRKFSNTKEQEDAQEKRNSIEQEISERQTRDNTITCVTATIIPAPQSVLERRLLEAERRIDELNRIIEKGPPKTSTLNKDNLPIGMILQGQSKGKDYTLEILEEDYLCSTGDIVPSLSAAAGRVSGVRRSGWEFWTDRKGTPIGTITGRFNKDECSDPFGAIAMPGV